MKILKKIYNKINGKIKVKILFYHSDGLHYDSVLSITAYFKSLPRPGDYLYLQDFEQEKIDKIFELKIKDYQKDKELKNFSAEQFFVVNNILHKTYTNVIDIILIDIDRFVENKGVLI